MFHKHNHTMLELLVQQSFLARWQGQHIPADKYSDSDEDDCAL